MRIETDHLTVVEHDDDCRNVDCECGRGTYHSCSYSSCFDCFLDRQADYVACIYCGRWHSPDFDTCFKCRPQGRDEAAADLRRVIFARDSFTCRYCGATEGEDQVDPRLARPKCTPSCVIRHNHRRACRKDCHRRHDHIPAGAEGLCPADCAIIHAHRAADDDGVRPVRLHLDHVKPCARGGTAAPWNLQTLCGVCNISKGADWWDGSRHDYARLALIAAYRTYLRGFLSEEEEAELNATEPAGPWQEYADLKLIKADFVERVKARRPRPRVSREVITEDVPPEYAWLDIPARCLCPGSVLMTHSILTLR